MKKYLRTALLVGAIACAGCHTGTAGCDQYDYGDGSIGVTAMDASTGALVPNATITLAVAPGDSSVLTVGSDVSVYPVQFVGVGTGTYNMTIVAQGYAPWQAKGGVTVLCTLPPTTVAARMQKSP